ncbi:MAG: acyl-[acyl-carrier-protein]--UDP-N-acetylglucosamine O-acyltransferase [Planctomycetaceae bacterium]|nr:acyl-[acyl-carrier-protein]--UDP-N-acetylglucosamine O-acyltransferase [Planctomycetaceae bacterium]
MATSIAANAWVDPRAELDDGVEVGPFSMIGPEVRVGRGTRLIGQVTLMGRVDIGPDNVIYPNAVVGGEPQDVSYQGSPTQVVIGEGNVLREGVTVNRGTEKEEGVTRIGDHNLLMAGVHVAHDCQLGSHITIANATLLAGHVHVHDHASISGSVAVHHFVTIGRYSFIGGLSRALHDIPPYMLCEGSPARPRCINIVALRRNQFSREVIDNLAAAHKLLYRSKVGPGHAYDILKSKGHLCTEVEELFQFLQGQQQGKHGRGREMRRAA